MRGPEFNSPVPAKKPKNRNKQQIIKASGAEALEGRRKG
jgi:hypothetical protein